MKGSISKSNKFYLIKSILVITFLLQYTHLWMDPQNGWYQTKVINKTFRRGRGSKLYRMSYYTKIVGTLPSRFTYQPNARVMV